MGLALAIRPAEPIPPPLIGLILPLTPGTQPAGKQVLIGRIA
jgi:hypothetical protein